MSDPRDEIRQRLDALTDDQARTALGWLRGLQRATGGQRLAPGPERTMGPLAELLGITTVEEEPGRLRLRVTADPAFHNPNGVLHGGVIYTMVDYGMGGAVQRSLPPEEYCATVNITINYLASAREGTLTADVRVVKQGRNVAFTEAEVRDSQDRLIATATGTMFIFRPG